MTTIDPDKSIRAAELLNLKAPHPVEENRGVPFDAVFKPLIESTKKPDASLMISDPAAATLSGIRPARFSTKTQPERTAVMEKVHQVLDTLDAYQRKLGDESASLKEMDPILETLISRNESLKATADALPSGDEALKSIINQSLSLSSMEIARFRSGVYNG